MVSGVCAVVLQQIHGRREISRSRSLASLAQCLLRLVACRWLPRRLLGAGVRMQLIQWLRPYLDALPDSFPEEGTAAVNWPSAFPGAIGTLERVDRDN